MSDGLIGGRRRDLYAAGLISRARSRREIAALPTRPSMPGAPAHAYLHADVARASSAIVVRAPRSGSEAALARTPLSFREAVTKPSVRRVAKLSKARKIKRSPRHGNVNSHQRQLTQRATVFVQ